MQANSRESKILFCVVIVFIVAWYLMAFVLPNHPSRPKNVPKSATLVLRAPAHFWQECWFDSVGNQDRCRIYNGGGVVLGEGIFLPLNGGDAVPQNQLIIAPGGSSYTVVLKNGEVLIPQTGFDETKRELNGDFSGAK